MKVIELNPYISRINHSMQSLVLELDDCPYNSCGDDLHSTMNGVGYISVNVDNTDNSVRIMEWEIKFNKKTLLNDCTIKSGSVK